MIQNRTGQVWAHKYRMRNVRHTVYLLITDSDEVRCRHHYFAFYDTAGGLSYHSQLHEDIRSWESWDDIYRVA